MKKTAAKIGLMWGIGGVLIGVWTFGTQVLGGLLLSPFIGIVMTILVPLFMRVNKFFQIVISIIGFYLAAFLFGLGMGTVNFLLQPEHRIASSVILEGGIIATAGFTWWSFISLALPLLAAFVLSYISFSALAEIAEYGE